MQARRTLAPGQNGNKKLCEEYGKLLYVRCRYDAERQRRPLDSSRQNAADAMVGVRVAFQEAEMQRNVKQAGGKWNPQRRLWEMRYDQAVAIGLEDRIEESKVSISRNLSSPLNKNSSAASRSAGSIRHAFRDKAIVGR